MENTVTAFIASLKIAMNRASDNGISADQFEKLMMSEQGKKDFLKLVESCIKELNKEIKK